MEFAVARRAMTVGLSRLIIGHLSELPSNWRYGRPLKFVKIRGRHERNAAN